MGVKLIHHNQNQDLQKQVNDMRKNEEILTREIDGLLKRVTQLESDKRLSGGIQFISKV